jgi:thioredoxin-like negative regulator of GroEL
MEASDPRGAENKVVELAAAEDITSRLAGGKKTVVLFETAGCPFCRAFRSRFLDFVENRCGDCAILRVRLDDPRSPLWQKYGIRAVPTVIIFANGEIQSRVDAVPFLGISQRKWAEFSARS